MFGHGSLDPGTLLGLGVVLAAVGTGLRLAAGAGLDPFPVPLLAGLIVSAAGPLHALRPDAAVTRPAAEIAVTVLLFCLGLDHGDGDRRAAAATLPARRLIAVDAVCTFTPAALFGLLGGFGATGAVLLGGVGFASSWGVATATLDREHRFGHRETPAVLATLVLEHGAIAVTLPLAAALLAPGDAVARITALLGSAALVAAAVWLVLGPAPLLRAGLFAGPGGRPAVLFLAAGLALALAGVATSVGVASAGVAYLAGAVLAAPGPGRTGDPPPAPDPAAGDRGDGGTNRAIAALREVSAGAAGLALGLLVPAGNLPGAVAGGLGLAALTTVGKLATGWWAAGRLGVAGAGRRRAGLTLVPKGELAVALALLAGQSAPERGPGSGLAALVATVIVLTSAVAPAIAAARRPGWYRWAVPTPAAARPEPPGT